jgi:hypothetical protein
LKAALEELRLVQQEIYHRYYPSYSQIMGPGSDTSIDASVPLRHQQPASFQQAGRTQLLSLSSQPNFCERFKRLSISLNNKNSMVANHYIEQFGSTHGSLPVL